MDTIEHNSDFLNKKPAETSRIRVPKGLRIYYLLISVVILVGGIIFFITQKNQVTSDKFAELSSLAELKVSQITNYRAERYAEGHFLYGNQTFIQTLKKFLSEPNAENKSHLNDWLATILTNHAYVDINIIDPVTDKIIYSISNNGVEHIGERVSDAAKCLETGLITFGDLERNPADSSIHLDIFVPLILRTDTSIEKVGIVQFVINPENGLFEIMQSWPTKSKTGEVLVVKKEGGNVLFLNELRFRKHAAMTFKLPITTTDLPAAWVAAKDIETVKEGTDYRNKQVLAATRKIPGTDWNIVVKIDTDEVYSGLLMRGILIFGLITAMLVALALGFIAFWRNREAHYYKSRLVDLDTINKLNRIYKLMSNVEQIIIKADNKENLLKEACEIIFNDGGYDLCWIGMLNRELGHIEQIAQFATYERYLETSSSAVTGRLSEEKNVFWQTIISGGQFISNDIHNDPNLSPEREQLINNKLKSLAAFPLFQDSTSIGVIKVYSVNPNHFLENEIKLLSGLALELSFALKKIDAERNEELIKKELIDRENKLLSQNEELASLNEKRLSAIERLKESNENIQRINKELIVAREKAEESDRLKSTFLANMSHEIRTPMNAIIGFAGFLGKSDLADKDREEYSKIIVDRSDELLQIINDILDISKIESKTLVLYPEAFILDTLLNDLKIIYTNKLNQSKGKNIRLESKYPVDGIPFTLTTDLLKFRQIFTNLLDNALKFTEAGEIQFGYYSSDENTLTCFVSDSGLGIDPEYKDKIFEVFRQAEPPPERIFRGTGLGLAICRGNAKLLGGDIWVESEQGKGSKFYFSVNYNQIEREIPEQKQAEIKDFHWKVKRILIIEDDEFSIEYLKKILEKSEAELYIAHDGKEAKKYFERLYEIDLILLDMKLPDTSGLNLVKEIKAIRKNLPVIAQTAFAMENDRIKCIEAGCDDYISKPYKRDELLSMITVYL